MLTMSTLFLFKPTHSVPSIWAYTEDARVSVHVERLPLDQWTSHTQTHHGGIICRWPDGIWPQRLQSGARGMCNYDEAAISLIFDSHCKAIAAFSV